MTLSFLPNNAFPLPASIVPKLVALGLDDKTAAKVSKVYLSSALTLKGMLETEYTNACNALLAASDNRGYSSKELRVKLLTVSITRYMQALSKCLDESIEKAEASLLRRNTKRASQFKVKCFTAPSPEPSHKGAFELRESAHASEHNPFNTSPPHAFPHPYPPPVRPEPISFVTHIPLSKRGTRCKPRTISDSDLDACIDTLSRLSLGPLSPRGGHSQGSSKTVPKSRPRIHTIPTPKLASQFFPSCPRLVSPMLDTSVVVSHKSIPKHAPSYPPPTILPRTQNIDIPRSNRRKACPVPYRRPTMRLSSSPESPSSPSSSRSIHRAPSLVSDHGSEASSPSTPPDFPSTLLPTSASAQKDSFPETMPSLEHSPVRHPRWHGIDFGNDLYG